MLDYIFKELEKRNLVPLYIIKSGSFLYGTNSETSDIDYKVIFLSPLRDLILKKDCQSFEITTGNNNEKNTCNDVDISFKSLHTFIKDVCRGETNAIDIAFSLSNPDAVLYKDDRMDEFFDNISKFYDIKNMKAFVGYANSQAIKYTVKGERYNLLNNIVTFLKEHTEWTENKIITFSDDIITNFSDPSNVFIYKKDGNDLLHILNADYMMSNTYSYLLDCLEKKLSKYGYRTRTASTENVDWKALSHAVRVLLEYKELILTGQIIFPLQQRELIKQIKYGGCDFQTVSNILETELYNIDELLKNDLKNTRNNNFIENFILSFYDLGIIYFHRCYELT